MIPTHRDIHAKLEIGRTDGATWVDVSEYLSSISVELGSIEDLGTGTGADIGVRSVEFELRNDGQLIAIFDNSAFEDEDIVLGDEDDVIGEDNSQALPFLVSIFGDNKWLRESFAPKDKTSDWNTFQGQWMPLLWPYRQAVFQAATPVSGNSPNWRILVDCLLGDSIKTDGSTVMVRARDMSKRLQDIYIDTPTKYGGEDAQIPIETMIQQILSNWVPNPPILYSPAGGTGITVDEYDVEYVSVWDAIQEIAKQVGWFLGYRWDGEKFALVLFNPPREKETADFEFDSYEDIYHEELEITDMAIRNAISVSYRDKTTGARVTLSWQDYPELRNDSSIAEYGLRVMSIEEADTSLINTQQQALALGRYALHDLSEASATDRLELPFMPELDIFDTIAITNPRTGNSRDFYAVESIRHTLVWEGNNSRFRTEVIASGRVIGARSKWLEMEPRPGSPGRPINPDKIPLLPNVPIEMRHGSGLVSRFNTAGLFLTDPNDPDSVYSARMVFGTASDGDYVPLSWQHQPKVIVAPYAMLTYLADESNNNQRMKSWIENVSPEGFQVFSRLMIPGAETINTVNYTLSSPNTQWTSGSSAPGVQDIRVSLRLYKEAGSLYSFSTTTITQTYRIEYLRLDGGSGSWQLFGNFSDTRDLYNGNWFVRQTITATNTRSHTLLLPVGQYQIRVTYTGFSWSGGNAFSRSGNIRVNDWQYRTDQIAQQGDVIYFAIEGGAIEEGDN